MKGEVVYLYAFDVANEIITSKVSEVLANRPVPFEIRIDHTLPKDVPLYKPLSIDIAPLASRLAGQLVKPFIRVYDVGVVSIVIRVPFTTENLFDLSSFHRPVLENGKTLDQVARDLCDDACKSLKGVMVDSSISSEPEAYTVFCLTDIGAGNNLPDWLVSNHRTIAELLTENKPGSLSDMQVNEVLHIQRAYSNADVTIIDWDAALVVDLTGYVDDSLYVLELANLQLEEYRVMDQRLDRYLNTAYDHIKRTSFSLFGTYSAILRNLRIFRVDVTKLNDEVTHITKFFGDWYLARVYMGARERFHLNQWKNSVEERLKQLDTLYSVVHTEVTNLRMLWLEVLIVILFALDILGIFFFKR